MLDRQALEKLEANVLAPFAEQAARSRGRRYAEANDPLRTAFGRDRDRIVHSAAYRRLGNKTQVFVALEGEYYRTRLTHTEEATQIALTMARALGLNLDLTEAICRAHDLGHAPFGHAGEAALADRMIADGGFEHNAHALRIVDLLECEYPAFPGLNLSWEVREGIARHGSHPVTEAGDGFLDRSQPSIEAQVTDLADGIAYGCHDLDDGLAAGVMQWQMFDDLAPAWWVAIRDRVVAQTAGLAPDLARRFLKRFLVNLFVTDAVAVTGRQLDRLSPRSADEARSLAQPLAALSPEVQALRTSLHEFLTACLYRHYLTETIWVKAKRLVSALFDTFDRDPGQLPPAVRARIGADCSCRRAICDYIAEMTDRAAVREYQRLFEFDIQLLP
jgi:dGTPase